MELSKQEMELFLPLPGLRSKTFSYKMFLYFTEEFKIGMELFIQEMEWFLSLPGLGSKNLFYHFFFIFTKVFKMDFQNRK